MTMHFFRIVTNQLNNREKNEPDHLANSLALMVLRQFVRPLRYSRLSHRSPISFLVTRLQTIRGRLGRHCEAQTCWASQATGRHLSIRSNSDLRLRLTMQASFDLRISLFAFAVGGTTSMPFVSAKESLNFVNPRTLGKTKSRL